MKRGLRLRICFYQALTSARSLFAYTRLKLSYLSQALTYAPNDAGIAKEAAALEKRRQARLAKQRAAYSKMFS